MKKQNKAHLLYLTGLSVDKNRMNNITENINFDKDYSFFLKLAQKNLDGMFSKKNKNIGKITNYSKKIAGKTLLEDFIPDTNITSDDSLFNTFEGVANEEFEESLLKKIKKYIDKKIIEPAIEKPAKLLGYKNIDEILKDNETLKNIMKSFQGSVPKYVNGDFFSLYLANQSDSIGVQPLSKLSTKHRFNIEHAYCDWDYYGNKYIDHVVLKVNTKRLKDNWEIELSKVFNIHINDILLSRIIEENKIKYTKKTSNKKLSLLDLILENNEKYSKSDILKTLSDRNFFGISLLSQVLYAIQKLSKNNMPISISNNEDINDTNSGQYHFLKELLEMSSDTTAIIGNNVEDSMIGAKIYFSDGIKLTKGINQLIKDEYFLSTNKANSKDKYSLYNDSSDKDFLKNIIEKENIHTISYEYKGEKDKTIINYIHDTEYDYAYIKVPIKMMLSLPLNQNEKVDSDLYLPSCLINESDRTIDVLTVGGAEHNRALAHLINKHRLKYKNERLFGFMDNYFDFEHKAKLDSDRRGIHNSYNFFMGINQPVAGWNFILAKREDDTDGNSINSDIKLITFKLEDKFMNKKINIVSIYGFSAIASVLGVNIFIEEIRHNNFKRGDGIFTTDFSKLFQGNRINNDRGTTATLFFYKNLYDVISTKDASNSLYNHMQISLKKFSQHEEKILKERLGEDLSKLITKKTIKNKYNLVIDIEYKDKEEGWLLKDKLNTITPKDIKLGQIKNIVRFFFNKKCYLNVFNNDLKRYSKILYYNNEKNNLLICDIKRGSVSATN